MARYSDLMELKNDTARGNAIRERVGKVIYNALVAEFGEDFTVMLPKAVSVYDGDIPKNAVCADIGDVTDKDGCTVGAVVEVGVKVKSWNTVVTKRLDISGKPIVRHAVTLDDILIALEDPEDN